MDAAAFLGEGPIWDERDNVLYWVDIRKSELHLYEPSKGTDTVAATGQLVGTVVPREKKKGSVVLAMENGLYYMNIDKNKGEGKLTFIGDPESDKPDNRFNDGKCDPAGRLFAGTMGKQGERGVGALYMLDIDGTSISKVFDGISISNGIVWSRDRKTMYYIDSPVKKVWAFDYDIATGAVSNRRDAIDGKAEAGVFDGMTDDRDGMLWIAHYGGSKVTKWDPVSGVKLDEIVAPAPNVTACAFGGENLETLYITTAKQGMSDADLAAWPQSGGLFAIRPGVRGVPSYKFAG